MRVGVVVPVHGWAPYLAEALDGILAQDPAPEDVVVVDDGSTEPVQLHADHAPHCRLVRREERGGLPAARRTGLAALDDSELVALCDDDDVWRPGKLRAQLAALRDAPGEGMPAGCFARTVVIGPDGRETGERWPDPPTTLPGLYERNPVCVSGALLRRDAVERAGGIARDLPAAEDWDLWLRLLGAGERFVVAQDAVVAYRRRAGAMTADVAALARAQLTVHADHAGLVDEATRRRTEARDLRALAAGLVRAGDPIGARATYARAGALEPLPAADRARAALLRVPVARRVLGRRDPYRARGVSAARGSAGGR